MTFTLRAGRIHEYEGEATLGRLLAGTFGGARVVVAPTARRRGLDHLRIPFQGVALAA
jgi:hypothetical protein